jgi:hypothetical protein
LATFTSVAASVTVVGCTTLCTWRLNIGSIRFPEAVLIALSVVEVLDLREVCLDRGIMGFSSGSAVGVSERGMSSSNVGVEGLEGLEKFEKRSAVLRDGLRRAATLDSDRSRRGGRTTSWIWRLRGFFDAVGGGLTMMYCYGRERRAKSGARRAERSGVERRGECAEKWKDVRRSERLRRSKGDVRLTSMGLFLRLDSTPTLTGRAMTTPEALGLGRPSDESDDERCASLRDGRAARPPRPSA